MARQPFSRIAITGAAGAIGSTLRRGLRGHYEGLHLLDIKSMAPAEPSEELHHVDILDLDATTAALRGVDCVVHLAGIPREDVWETILQVNIMGCFNVFEAARRAGVRRIVFASSNHAVGFYRCANTIDADVVPRPDSRYGVSKVFGEALGRFYADKHGMSVAALRIGSFLEKPLTERHLMTWISPDDTVRLVRACIDHPDYHFVVVYGVSKNDRAIWDNSKVAWLGYEPQDNAEAFAEEVLGKETDDDPIAALFHGGPFCSEDFDGDPGDIL